MRAIGLFLVANLAAASPWEPARVDRALAGMDYLLLVRENGTTLRRGGMDPAKRWLPCSTFKLPHALIALEKGAITLDADQLDCNPNECHTGHGRLGLAGAIRASCVSYFRQLARRLGSQAEREGMVALGYPATGSLQPLDGFWLSGPDFGITAREQLAWIHRFYSEGLGVKPEHLAAVRAATRRTEGPGAVLWGKTGSSGGRKDGPPYGWFVGRVAWKDGHSSDVVLLVQEKAPSLLGPEAQARLEGLLSR